MLLRLFAVFCFCEGFSLYSSSYRSLSGNMTPKDISSSPVSKKREVYKCTYKIEWSKKYPVTKSNGNPYAFYCVPCKKSISCAHQGLSDLTVHYNGKIHKSFKRAIKTTRNLCSLNLAGQTIRTIMVEHNTSFLSAKHLLPLYA